jgi:hypothetical protein
VVSSLIRLLSMKISVRLFVALHLPMWIIGYQTLTEDQKVGRRQFLRFMQLHPTGLHLHLTVHSTRIFTVTRTQWNAS